MSYPTYADSLMIFLIELDGLNFNRFVKVSATVLKERYEKKHWMHLRQ
jgi:hypothetical protein